MAPGDRRRPAQAGFTLVELLIVAAVLGFALAAVFGIYQVTQRTALFARSGEDAQSSARALLDRMAADLRMMNAARPIPAPPSAPTGFVTAATATSITFLGDIDSDTLDASRNDATLTALAAEGATTVQVSSAAGFAVGESLYLEDGTVEATVPITGVSGTTLTLAAGLGTWYPAGAIARSVESVTWAWDPASGAVCRRVGGACTPPFAADLVVATGVTDFQITYFDAGGNVISVAALGTQAGRDSIRRVGVAVTVTVGEGDQMVSRRMEIQVRPRSL
jgi:prepilin-type N-terminal cleavage/methylation domain-containing protein